MSELTVPVDTLVPISRFGRGTANAEFAKVEDGRPVTVLRNNEPVYLIINVNDYRKYKELEDEVKELRNQEARRQVASKEYTHHFNNVDEMDAYFDSL